MRKRVRVQIEELLLLSDYDWYIIYGYSGPIMQLSKRHSGTDMVSSNGAFQYNLTAIDHDLVWSLWSLDYGTLN